MAELERKLDEAKRRAREQAQERRDEKVLLAGEVRALQDANASLRQELSTLRLSAQQPRAEKVCRTSQADWQAQAWQQ